MVDNLSILQQNTPRSTAVPQVAVAYGDGIGPEIMQAVLDILSAAGAELEYRPIQVGNEAYKQGVSSGIPDSAWDVLRETRMLLKAPITTPQGGGYKSLNVTIRKTLGLYANVRPVKAFSPFVESRFSNLDVVIIRENEEDLYAGIEHQQTDEVVQCLKLVSRQGCERIVRYAFEYARNNGRKKVTCMTKDNIMKLTDGLFHRTFDEVAREYPDIETNHFIIDIGAALLADRPEQFDVVVTLNLYGDIISDIVAQVAGSVGLAGSANIGERFALFEAIHGSAPDIAGKNLANPSGLLQAACMMLLHLGQSKVAEKIQNAWLRTLEDGIHTGDVASENFTRAKVGTREFAQAVIDRLGQMPSSLASVNYPASAKPIQISISQTIKGIKQLVGVDIFIHWNEGDRNPDQLGSLLEPLAGERLQLKMITNRGVKVYPNGFPETHCTDNWRCRFVSQKSTLKVDNEDMDDIQPIRHAEVLGLLARLEAEGIDFIKMENLYVIDGKRAYSLGQGE